MNKINKLTDLEKLLYAVQYIERLKKDKDLLKVELDKKDSTIKNLDSHIEKLKQHLKKEKPEVSKLTAYKKIVKDSKNKQKIQKEYIKKLEHSDIILRAKVIYLKNLLKENKINYT